MTADGLTYVVGEERELRDLLCDADVLPLLQGAVSAGAVSACLVDQTGEGLWKVDAPAEGSELVADLALILEGEPVARVQVNGEPSRREQLQALAELLRVALDTVVRNNLKRMLTTEIHTTVVKRSFEEQLLINAELSKSEARYRELAQNLELRVKERTEQLEKAQIHLLQQEKMAAIGQLAAGIAHEINNPLGFVISNLHTLQKYVARFTAMLQFYRQHLELDLPIGMLVEQADQKWRELKLQQVVADVGDLMSQSVGGAERVARIVADLKGFSHVDEAEAMPVDLNVELERTLSVLSHQLRDKAHIVRKLQALPPITCPPQLAGQIFLNLIQNALVHCGPHPTITIASCYDGERIRVSVADDGPGVPEELRDQIFHPFFTTRPVGSGTGMGLAVAWEAALQLNGGITVTDAAGGGAEFVLTIAVPKGSADVEVL
uniref:histidine kinase n=1 Tax=Geobacter sp. (strain M21) TaxID=443144 RepID=C6DZA5_GEOSM